MTDRTTFSVVFFCKKTKLNKKGKAPIYARITTSGGKMESKGRKVFSPRFRIFADQRNHRLVPRQYPRSLRSVGQREQTTELFCH